MLLFNVPPSSCLSACKGPLGEPKQVRLDTCIITVYASLGILSVCACDVEALCLCVPGWRDLEVQLSHVHV